MADPDAPLESPQRDQRVALVVGGYGGIGKAVCAQLAAAGDLVVVAGRSRERGALACKELAQDGVTALPCVIDLANRGQTERAVRDIAKAHGRLDVVVNLAAIDAHGPALDLSQPEWDRVIETNLSGSFWLAQAAGRAMISGARPGRIILTSSTRSEFGGRRGFAAYGASKAGVNLLAKQLSTEWAQHGITVNAVAPGFVPTDMTAGRDAGFTQMMLQRIPAGRFARPCEVAAAITFLASTQASFITGQVLFVDGGVSASS